MQGAKKKRVKQKREEGSFILNFRGKVAARMELRWIEGTEPSRRD